MAPIVASAYFFARYAIPTRAGVSLIPNSRQRLDVTGVVGSDERDRVARQQRLRQLFQQTADAAHDAFRNMKQRTAMPARLHDDLHHFVERHQIGTADVVSAVAPTPRHRERHACREIVDEHRLNLLPPGTGHAEDRRETQRARESVDDFVLRPVHQRRAEYCVARDPTRESRARRGPWRERPDECCFRRRRHR